MSAHAYKKRKTITPENDRLESLRILTMTGSFSYNSNLWWWSSLSAEIAEPLITGRGIYVEFFFSMHDGVSTKRGFALCFFLFLVYRLSWDDGWKSIRVIVENHKRNIVFRNEEMDLCNDTYSIDWLIIIIYYQWADRLSFVSLLNLFQV